MCLQLFFGMFSYLKSAVHYFSLIGMKRFYILSHLAFIVLRQQLISPCAALAIGDLICQLELLLQLHFDSVLYNTSPHHLT